jgi:hypothetical protein
VDIDAGYMVEFTVREEALVDYLGAYPNVRRVPFSSPGKRTAKARRCVTCSGRSRWEDPSW